MSFFNDFIESLGVDNLNEQIYYSCIIGIGAIVVGKLKILVMNEDEIIVGNNEKKLQILGKNMKIKSISTGEINILGEIKNIKLLDKCDE